MSERELSGVIPVYKARDWTSFDVVAKLRGILHIRRIGHGGTLDPMAEGVLPVFVGKATKACDVLPDRLKEYTAGFRFGITTDTQDITGEVIRQSSLKPDAEEIAKGLPNYVGHIKQVPPMYSAVKVGGKKLYELAREGRTIEREARDIVVHGINIMNYDRYAAQGMMHIICEKGTYVRTLINDIGAELGCGGTMTSLVRTYSSGLAVKQCMRIEEIAMRVINEGAESVVMPVDKCFGEYEEVRLDGRLTGLYKNGVKLRAEQVGLGADDEAERRVYGDGGEFLGIGRMMDGEFRSIKNFYG